MRNKGRILWTVVLALFVFTQIYLLIYQTSNHETTDAILSTQATCSFINIIIIISWIVFEKRRKKHCKRCNSNQTQSQVNTYTIQRSYGAKNLFTAAEKRMYEKIKHVLRNENVIIQAQIPLSSVVEKFSLERYAGELYRTIDFGVFAPNGNVIVLIELN